MKLNVEKFSMWLMAYKFFPAIEKFYEDPENMEAFENWLKKDGRRWAPTSQKQKR